MNIVQFLCQTIGKEKREEIVRCLNKATLIVYDGENCIVGDDIYIYYFATTANRTKKFYKFYHQYEKYMDKKLFYAGSLPMYKNRCKQIEGDLYQWLG